MYVCVHAAVNGCRVDTGAKSVCACTYVCVCVYICVCVCMCVCMCAYRGGWALSRHWRQECVCVYYVYVCVRACVCVCTCVCVCACVCVYIPRWMGAESTLASRILNLQLRMGSSHSGPSRVPHCIAKSHIYVNFRTHFRIYRFQIAFVSRQPFTHALPLQSNVYIAVLQCCSVAWLHVLQCATVCCSVLIGSKATLRA